MPIEQKRFAGILNLDDSPQFVLPNQHIDALNIRFYGGAQGLIAQNIPGNVQINHAMPGGTNQCIGSFYDALKQRIYWFNWNSLGINGIYYLDIITETVYEVLVSFTDSQTDIFEFDLDYPIASVNIVYTTETDGDILTWTARNDKPKQLNIKDALDNLYGTQWKAEYLDVAKERPTIPPVCAYEDDNTSIVNNLKNKLYRFKYRFVYGTFQKSVWSSISKMPIPLNYADQAVDTDPTKNCVIRTILQTGTADVLKIEIAAQENLGVGWGNFFLVDILDKSELAIPSNDTYIWGFSNNEAYDYIDEAESILLFDYVPNIANTQELLNGNVLIYGGITEGYDPVVPDVSVAVQDSAISEVPYPIGILATQSGTNGLSTGNIRISLVGIPVINSNPSGASTDVYVTLNNGVLDTTINAPAAATLAGMITLLSSAATGAGFTVLSVSSNSIVIDGTGLTLQKYYTTGNGNNLKDADESLPANEFTSKYNYGIAYFAEKSKTNGVTTSEDFVGNITPIDFTATDAAVFDLTKIQLTINHRPPLWAKYWMPVRTNNLTKTSFLSWVSDRTFKDDQFAYISIESINIYKVQHETSIISYDFVVGDRIKFACLFNDDKTVAQDYGNTHDYEIVGQVVNPNINGLVQGGTFVKINLPTTDINFDFGNFTSNDYYYYYIELYTPAKSVANGLDVYYEIGEMYEVGNEGTATCYHQANSQNQTANLSQPAIAIIYGGDSWYRVREVRAGAFFRANTVPNVTYQWVNEPIYQQTIDNIPVGTSYEVKNTTAGNTTNANNWLIKTGIVPVNFNVKGKLIFQSLLTTSSNLFIFILLRNIGGGGTGQIQLAQITGASNGQILEFNIDQNITIPANRTAVIYLQESPVSSPFPFTANSISGQLTFIDTEHDFTVGVIDPNFSDFYESKVNSNGRALVENPDETELFYPTLLRWGLSYQQNTNINQLNRFFPANFDEIDRSKGDIQRLRARDRIMRVFQNRACAQYGVYARFIQNNQGESQLVTTDDIITKGNINYYAGQYGMGTQYTSLVSGKNQDYFVDVIRGYQMRLSTDGLTPISELYKGQFYIRNLLVPYNKDYARSGGGIARILGCFNYFDEEWVCLLQAGGSQDTGELLPYAFSFNEKRNGYSTFHSYNTAEWLESGQDLMFMWKEGRIWKLDIGNPTGSYCNYFGTQYSAHITVVFNANFLQVKTWESLTEIASAVWNCPIIYTNIKTYGTQRQESRLIDQNFENLESEFKSAFYRDIHSIGGWLNGDVLKGSWLVCKFKIDTPTSEVTLSEVSVLYQDSPLNKR